MLTQQSSHVLAHEALVEVGSEKVLCHVSVARTLIPCLQNTTYVDEFLLLALVFSAPRLVLEDDIVVPSITDSVSSRTDKRGVR